MTTGKISHSRAQKKRENLWREWTDHCERCVREKESTRVIIVYKDVHDGL
jgi:hypothetical protein